MRCEAHDHRNLKGTKTELMRPATQIIDALPLEAKVCERLIAQNKNPAHLPGFERPDGRLRIENA